MGDISSRRGILAANDVDSVGQSVRHVGLQVPTLKRAASVSQRATLNIRHDQVQCEFNQVATLDQLTRKRLLGHDLVVFEDLGVGSPTEDRTWRAPPPRPSVAGSARRASSSGA